MNEETPVVKQLIQAFLKVWPDAEYGPCHHILSDWNLEDEWLHEAIAKLAMGHNHPCDAATIYFLHLLLQIPESERCWYDAEDEE